jgi:hypothetical protein
VFCRPGDVVRELWQGNLDRDWAEPLQAGDPAFPPEVPEVRHLLVSDMPRLSEAWLRKSPLWVFLWVIELCRQHADEAWPVLLSLLDSCRNDKDLAVLAAGPLEEMLVARGREVIARLEAEAAESPRFRRLLSGVWRRSIDEAVWVRVQAARGGEPGLDDPS